MTAPATLVSQYRVDARSTDVFGRVLCSARDHHFVVDGPVQNGCPGEELTPPELFLSAVAACGVELVHVIARDQEAPLGSVELAVHGTVDRGNQSRTARLRAQQLRAWHPAQRPRAWHPAQRRGVWHPTPAGRIVRSARLFS